MKDKNLLFYHIILVLVILILLFLFYTLLFSQKSLRHSRASLFYNKGHYDKAAKIWEKDINSKDKDYIPESSLGKAFYKQGKFEESIKKLEDALKENNEVSELHYDLGNAYYRDNQIDNALQEYLNAMLLDPNDENAKANYELALKKKNTIVPQFGFGENNKEENQQDSPEQSSREEMENRLNALDQKEARDRMAKNPPPFKGKGDKWW
ncbi:MAG: tetratricopeptide repeat protein [Candidatus Cloacimonetes bacterium]|jgi:tetratricopeptide (TPR) repeat protein|nr:tetratricopeptide repeat protein [Candidatus Cloacimonadota bacterium]